MRLLYIASLSTLALLCLPVPASHGYEIESSCHATSTCLRQDSPSAFAATTTGERDPRASAQESVLLELGKPIERELAGGQSHSYGITLASAQYLQVVVDQRGIDVVVTLFAPDARKLSEVDSPNGIAGPEPISTVADAGGSYRIEVRSLEKTADKGRYQIRVEELRAATTEDRYRVEAESAVHEAGRLGNGTAAGSSKSMEKYEEASALFRKAGDRLGESRALNNIGEICYSLGERRKALEKFQESLLLRREMGDRRGEAESLNDIGVVYWSLGEYKNALEMLNAALLIRQSVGDNGGVGESLHNIGSVYLSLGDLQKALEKFNEALPLKRAIGDRYGEAATINSIGQVYLTLGEPEKALESYNQSLPLIRAVSDRGGEAITLNNIAHAYYSLGEMQKALEKYKDAQQLARETGNRYAEILTRNGMGTVYQSLGEKEKALQQYNESLPIVRAVGDRNSEALILGNIGMSYYLLGEMQRALEKLNEALTLIRVVGNRDLEAGLLQDIGQVLNASGEPQQALAKYNEALPIARSVGDRTGEADLLLGIAQAEQKRGNLTQARRSVEEAIKITESQRANIKVQELRATYLALRQDFYQSYIEILIQLQKQDPTAGFDSVALGVSEHARARVLLEVLNEARADIRQGVDSSLLERERSLQQRLATRAVAQANLLNGKHTPEQAEAIAKEISSITTGYEEVEAQIRGSSPRYAALTQPQPLNLKEIQQRVLDPETLLLEYSLGDDASYLFLVSQTSISSYQLPKRSEIETAARRVYDLLTAQQPKPGETAAELQVRIADNRKNYWSQAAALSRMLIGPVASQLGQKRLAIVADGALQYIPFAALPLPSTENGDPQPLLVDHEIVSIPSASTLATLRSEIAGRKPAEKAIAVLADPVFADDDVRVRQPATRAERKGNHADSGKEDIASLQMTRSAFETGATGADARFSRLLNTRREAAAILALVPSRQRKQALDFQASRPTALNHDLANYRIIHFATHGLLNNLHPALSGIVLSLVDEEGNPQDGFLRLQDIYNLKLPAELVVLSACQTGLGKEIKGEGLIGLTRGFMYAGTPRVVASLWKVDDRATSELMKGFYQGMLGPERLRPAAALRQAQLRIWRENQWRAPYYWAAFLLQGEWK
ncbi:MAG: CHAT domain-containing protein [Blastocatellia bacterium]|nr:CHAT domain-containing protein [Blastocatellia bacterium]